MTIFTENINSIWGSLIIEELIRNGIVHFCISPGSRSTPLTAAAARNPLADTVVCFDERGAAFYALGFARGRGEPAALICTSGTAVANYLPAVVEASVDNVPMIILSADRPPELRQTGANQTIPQPNIFGEYVRWKFDMPCPDANINPQMVLSTIDQAVYRARRNPSGPVHLNCMFREPLAPVSSPVPKGYLKPVSTWNESGLPHTFYGKQHSSPDEEATERFLETLKESRRGLITVGRLSNIRESQAVLDFAEKLNWPVFADIGSGLRTLNSLRTLIPNFDLMLGSENFVENLGLETILHIGGQMTSKRFLQYTEKYPPENFIVIKDHPYRHDPVHSSTFRIEASIEKYLPELIPHVISNSDSDLVTGLLKKSDKINRLIESKFSELSGLSEFAVARTISGMLPNGSGLFLASSLPVREMDMFAGTGGSALPVAVNRGASGIDGTIASAIGYSAGLFKPVTLVIGDLAFLHDLNSLHLLNSAAHPLRIILLNNQGGGIFSFLPISEFKDIFEPYFGTPHQFDFSYASKLFGLEYHSPQNMAEFKAIFSDELKKSRSVIIELKTRRQDNIDLQKSILKDIDKLMESDS